MATAALLVVLANVLLGVSWHRLGRGLRPAVAAPVTVAVAVVATSAGLVSLSIIAFDAVAEIPVVAAHAQWSVSALEGHDPLPTPVGLGCFVVLVWLAGRTMRVTWRQSAGLRAVLALGGWRRDSGDAVDVVVTAQEVPTAFAVPALRGGQVMVSRGMLDALDADEHRVLIAHERSHLRHRHYLYVALARLVAATNPLHTDLPDAVSRAVERWADEDAAAATQDRTTTARAIARAALAANRATRATPRPAAALPIASSPIEERTEALLKPAAPNRPARVLAGVTLALLALSGTASLARATELRFEQAHAAFGAGSHH
jgi:Zn-dependent protease with chaperone function